MLGSNAHLLSQIRPPGAERGLSQDPPLRYLLRYYNRHAERHGTLYPVQVRQVDATEAAGVRGPKYKVSGFV